MDPKLTLMELHNFRVTTKGIINCSLLSSGKKTLHDFERLLFDYQAASLAIERSFKMKSKAFERSVNVAPLIPPLSKHFRHFSVITRRQCCVVKPLPNRRCHFESI